MNNGINNGWKLIADESPPNKKDIILTDGKYQCISSVLMQDGKIYIQFGKCGKMKAPTHWQPLPEPPSE
jgi:hypothetical protein